MTYIKKNKVYLIRSIKYIFYYILFLNKKIIALSKLLD